MDVIIGNSPKPSPDGGGRKSAEDLLAECIRLDASDLHLAPGMPPFFRVHGELAPHATLPPLSGDETRRIADVFLQFSGTSGLEERGAQDGALTSPEGARFRFNVFRRLGGIAVAVRRLEDRFRTLEELGLSESLYGLCDFPDGIILIAGPTGAGKSTTLATLIDWINRNHQSHIVTIEDPIEYIHTPVRSLVNQRQVGSDASSFNDALLASLREDPDVILVGEVRDLDTIRTAIRAAETGHLVFTTVHAGDCVSTLERLVSVFSADEQPGIRQQLSLVLRAIVAQHLLPGDGPQAKTSRGAGVIEGRFVASEVLQCTTAVAHLVATGKSAQIYSVMEGGSRLGMQTLEQDLARLVVEGKVSEATALANTRNPGIVRDRVALLGRQGNGRRSGGDR